MLPVLMAWHASNSFGWGIAGLNIFCHWAVSDTIEPYVLRPIVESDLTMVDPLRQLRIARSIVRSNGFSQRLAATSDKAISLNIPVVHAVGNRDIGARGRIQGKCNIGRTVIEDTRLDDWSASFAQFDVLVTASTWNMELLRANGAPEVVLIHEGIDPSLFHPGPRSGLLDPGRFYIFTGGKIEFRKAQDLVLLAFKRFSARHDDAVLVTSWHSPWPERERGFKGVLSSPVELGANGRLAIKKWAADNGVDPAKVIDIGAVPNQLM